MLNRLHNRIEPKPALFWALGIVLTSHAYPETSDPACRPGIPQLSYWHGRYGRGQLGSI